MGEIDEPLREALAAYGAPVQVADQSRGAAARPGGLGNAPGPYLCAECGSLLKTKPSLRAHVRQQHSMFAEEYKKKHGELMPVAVPKGDDTGTDTYSVQMSGMGTVTGNGIGLYNSGVTNTNASARSTVALHAFLDDASRVRDEPVDQLEVGAERQAFETVGLRSVRWHGHVDAYPGGGPVAGPRAACVAGRGKGHLAYPQLPRPSDASRGAARLPPAPTISGPSPFPRANRA